MNKVYLMGTVANEPRLVERKGSPVHQAFLLLVRHQARSLISAP
ncbi:MAG: hypothetical protein RR296_12495 [Clostridia bacterium]